MQCLPQKTISRINHVYVFKYSNIIQLGLYTIKIFKKEHCLHKNRHVIRTHTHGRAHTYIPTYLLINTQTNTRTNVRTNSHPSTHTRKHVVYLTRPFRVKCGLANFINTFICNLEPVNVLSLELRSDIRHSVHVCELPR